MKRRRRKVFVTPEDMEDSMMEYLNMVDEVNKPKFVVYDITNGDEYKTKQDAYKEGVDEKDLKSEFEKVPVYDMVRPTLSGFCAFAGTSMATYYNRAGKGGEWQLNDEWFRTLLEDEVEQLLLNPMNRNSSGAKMVAINRHGWADKKENEISGGGNVEIIYNIPNEN